MLDSLQTDPIAFTIPIGDGFPIYWYGILITIGIALGVWWAAREVVRRGGDEDTFYTGVLIVVISGYVFARIWYVLQEVIAGRGDQYQTLLDVIKHPPGWSQHPGRLYRRSPAGHLVHSPQAAELLELCGRRRARAAAGPGYRPLGELHQPGAIRPADRAALGHPHRPGEPYCRIPGPAGGDALSPDLPLRIALAVRRLHPARLSEPPLPRAMEAGHPLCPVSDLVGRRRTWIELFRPDQPAFGDSLVTYSMVWLSSWRLPASTSCWRSTTDCRRAFPAHRRRRRVRKPRPRRE